MQNQPNQSNPSVLSTGKVPGDHKIRVIFRGFIITQIKHGESSAWVGALDSSISPCHQPKIRVYKLFPPPPLGTGPLPLGSSQDVTPPDLVPGTDISLTVFPTPSRGIQVYQQDDEHFDRHNERHNNRKDFRWFLNLNEIHGQRVAEIQNKVRPKFTINKGVFHTSDRSEGTLRIRPDDTPLPVKHYGRFAVEITARVVLESGSYATCIGNVPLFPAIRAEDNFKYDIIYDCDCLLNDDSGVSDFPLIYHAIKEWDPTVPLRRVCMEPEDPPSPEADALDDNKAASPEVYCQGGNTGG